MKKSLELTSAHVKEMEAEQETWRKMGRCGTLPGDLTDNISNTKTQQVFHTKSVFGELGLVMKITRSEERRVGKECRL